MTRWQRLKYTIVEPDDEGDGKGSTADERSVEELEDTIRRSDDKERAIGLVAGPLAAIVGIIISSASIDYAKSHHLSVSVYDELTYVILGMSVLILVSSLLRKRLFQGITMALYGLAVFNLHYWGFGIPFVLGGAWYLVRAYRLQQALKRAQADAPTPPRRNGARATNGSRPRPNKRYTPPT
jgi:Ca2+/Na+ antiporter